MFVEHCSSIFPMDAIKFFNVSFRNLTETVLNLWINSGRTVIFTKLSSQAYPYIRQDFSVTEELVPLMAQFPKNSYFDLADVPKVTFTTVQAEGRLERWLRAHATPGIRAALWPALSNGMW